MHKSISFAQVMRITAIGCLSATVILALLYRTCGLGWILAAAITTFTTFYHFAMRLIVGWIVPPCVKHPMDCRWFQEKTWEQNLYRVLKVKRWKDRMPTYSPGSFSLKENTMQQIVDNCCVAEAVHEVIVLFSFVPLGFACWWGTFPVFLITSLLAAAFDGCFVIMQRYNRPRLIRILTKKEAKGL